MYTSSMRGAAAYQQTQVQCGTPLELVVKLYDAAITNIVKTRECAAKGDLRGKRDAISKTLAIISELQTALDMKTGGEIAVSLDALYTYITGRIIDYNASRKTASLDEAQRLLVTLREGWQQIANGKTAPPAGR